MKKVAAVIIACLLCGCTVLYHNSPQFGKTVRVDFARTVTFGFEVLGKDGVTVLKFSNYKAKADSEVIGAVVKGVVSGMATGGVGGFPMSVSGLQTMIQSYGTAGSNITVKTTDGVKTVDDFLRAHPELEPTK